MKKIIVATAFMMFATLPCFADVSVNVDLNLANGGINPSVFTLLGGTLSNSDGQIAAVPSLRNLQSSRPIRFTVHRTCKLEMDRSGLQMNCTADPIVFRGIMTRRLFGQTLTYEVGCQYVPTQLSGSIDFDFPNADYCYPYAQ